MNTCSLGEGYRHIHYPGVIVCERIDGWQWRTIGIR